MSRRTAFLSLLSMIMMALSFLPQPVSGDAQTAISERKQADPVARGKLLFQLKGCVVCHHHRAIPQTRDQFDIGPDLSDYAGSEAFLLEWLADPQAIKPEAQMPDLNLSEQQIAYLTDFLLADD